MDPHKDDPELIFKAVAGGRTFGIIVARNGLATAMTGRASLENVPATRAMLWLVDQNPRPDDEVRFSLVTAATPTSS